MSVLFALMLAASPAATATAEPGEKKPRLKCEWIHEVGTSRPRRVCEKRVQRPVPVEQASEAKKASEDRSQHQNGTQE